MSRLAQFKKAKCSECHYSISWDCDVESPFGFVWHQLSKRRGHSHTLPIFCGRYRDTVQEEDVSCFMLKGSRPKLINSQQSYMPAMGAKFITKKIAFICKIYGFYKKPDWK